MMARHDPTPTQQSTQASIKRFRIIGLELVVLVAALLLDSTLVVQSPAVDHQWPASRQMTVYVDDAYRVYLMDDGIGKLQTQFAACPFRYVMLKTEDDIEGLHPATGWYEQNSIYAVAFTAGDYFTVSSNTQFTMIFDNGDQLELRLSCAPPDHRMMITMRGAMVYLNDAANTRGIPLFSLMPLCDLRITHQGQQYRLQPDEMARPLAPNSGWLPPDSRVAMRFQVSGDMITVSRSGLLRYEVRYEGGLMRIESGCMDEFSSVTPLQSLAEKAMGHGVPYPTHGA